MTRRRCAVLSLVVAAWSVPVLGAETDFSGHWSIDLRTPSERQRKVECASAYFKLTQVHDRVSGDHGFATAGCERINEGGEGSVKGVVVDSTAVLVVTSSRNGAMVLGKATRKGSTLHWVTLEEVKPGEPEGDSPLILGEGVLSLDSSGSARAK